MKITFTYNEDKDIDCLLTKGGGSINSPQKPTKVYKELLDTVADIGDREQVREFVRSKRPTNIADRVVNLQAAWDAVSLDFTKRAEQIFGVKINNDITAYLTITQRFPYYIDGNYFYVSAGSLNGGTDENLNENLTCMHELWHFYTWQKFGTFLDKIGPSKYNEIKESLTVLLNVECSDLLNDELDRGYPQHQELRSKITQIWNKGRDIDEVWSVAVRG